MLLFPLARLAQRPGSIPKKASENQRSRGRLRRIIVSLNDIMEF